MPGGQNTLNLMVLVWTHSQTGKDHRFAGSSINNEYALVYPGKEPVSSLRWEAVRDGLEDIAAIYLLEYYIGENRRRELARFTLLIKPE